MKFRYFVFTIGLSLFIFGESTRYSFAGEMEADIPVVRELDLLPEAPLAIVGENKADTIPTREPLALASAVGDDEFLRLERNLFQARRDVSRLEDMYEELRVKYNTLVQVTQKLAEENLLPADPSPPVSEKEAFVAMLEDPLIKQYLGSRYADVYLDLTTVREPAPAKEEILEEQEAIKARQEKLKEIIALLKGTSDEIEMLRPIPEQPEKPVDERGLSQANELLFEAQKLYYRGRYREGLRKVESSLHIQQTGLGYALKGSFLFVVEDFNGAEEAWERALEINPDLEDVRDALRRLRRR